MFYIHISVIICCQKTTLLQRNVGKTSTLSGLFTKTVHFVAEHHPQFWFSPG